ncbi:MAG: hypothetical protein IKJ57_01830, partial [Oscillospiraceae bacterium]|nr:hypothetical protein [Oscillospiraceae bacterium]
MKKLISIILCLVIVLSMAVNAFAATAYPSQGGGTIPNIPGNWPTGPSFNATNPPRRDTETIVIDLTEEEPEENPTTGAPVFAVPAVIAAVAAAA